MKLSPAWLREFAGARVDDRRLAQDLTSVGIAVESSHGEGKNAVFEMEIGTNRPDAMNHYGVAREAAVIYNLALRALDAKLPAAPGKPDFIVEIADKDGCARYTARLIRENGFLGSFSISAGRPESDAFLDLVDFANRRQPLHQSIVCNSIASALRGEFGNYHATNWTRDSDLFINPLMAQYWTFDAPRLVAGMAYAEELTETERLEDARLVIERRRTMLDIRPRRPIPL